MSKLSIGHKKALPGISFASAYEQVLAALASEGFGALTEIDVKATLKKKLDAEFRPYTIIGACHPPSAYKVLMHEPDAGLLLPCNVVVESDNEGGSVVTVINARTMFRFIDNPEVAPVADEVDDSLLRVLDALG